MTREVQQSNSMSSLSGKKILISGALGDIGKNIAENLAQQGAHLCLSDLADNDRAQSALTSETFSKVQVDYSTVDTTCEKSVNAWVDSCHTKDKPIYGAVVNAGVAVFGDLWSTNFNDWKKVIDINLNGAYLFSRRVVQHLKDDKIPGRLVFIGSWVADTPQIHIPSYCVSKAGLRMLCRQLALDLAPSGILVNEVASGIVNAGLSAQGMRDNPAAKQSAIEKIPVRRILETVDVSREVLHLLHPENLHITGSTTVVDGGLSLSNYKS